MEIHKYGSSWGSTHEHTIKGRQATFQKCQVHFEDMEQGQRAGLEPQPGARMESNWGAQEVLRPGDGDGGWVWMGQ